MAERSRRVRLEDLTQGIRVDGLVAGGPVTILTTVQTAPDAFTVVFTRADGTPDHVLALRRRRDTAADRQAPTPRRHSTVTPPRTGWPPRHVGSRWRASSTRWSR